jgi:hypothetical protein
VSLLSATRFIVPRTVADFTDQVLRAAGDNRHEAFVLWSGVLEQSTFVVRNAHSPVQTAYRSDDGVCVRVDGNELHRLNVWLYQHSEMLGVQVHSHPTDAYHSDTDDTYPIATTVGALSIVVPEFGRRGLRGEGVAVYRFDARRWGRLGPRACTQLLAMEPNGAS